MKPAQFEYYEPTTVAEGLSLLAQFAETAKPLAGGQSLVPMMNMRLARPAQIIDLNHLSELDYLKVENGELRIGAMTRQRALERSMVVHEGWPLLQEATRFIGHVQIRNRGTVGGSLAHAFPSAELPVAMTTLNAAFVLRSARGERIIPTQEFFLDVMTTALKSDELVVEARVPQLSAGTGHSFQEVSRRHGDFALAGVAALITLDANGVINHARLTFTGSTPIYATKAEEIVLGQKPSEGLFREAARQATATLEQDSDIHASAEYRRQVCEVLARRALAEAATRSAKRAEAESR
jgi:CO/xanthine dehydrogenase FAD-binding subunit